jgi:dTDP-4-amino-4,6-dideoxygalactose transaminase
VEQGANNIPLLDLRRQHETLRIEIDSAIQEVIENGSFILGPNVRKFEEEFASYCNTNAAIGVGSGSDALLLSLQAVGIGPGDEVITAANTFISTVDAISRNGANPVLVDIDPETYTIDVGQLRKGVTPRTRAIIPVHMYGHPSKMDELAEVAEEKDLRIVEDACQAHGADFEGRKAGALGDVGCFSFYPSKNLGAYGDAGMIVTNNPEIAEEARALRNYGQTTKYVHKKRGYNSRLDEIQAAVLRVKLGHLENWNASRRKKARRYAELLKTDDQLVLPMEKPWAKHVYYLYVVRTQHRSALENWLSRNGIETGKHYPVPIHLQEAYSDSHFGSEDLTITTKFASQILSLPMFPELTDHELDYVASKVHQFFRETTLKPEIAFESSPHQ